MTRALPVPPRAEPPVHGRTAALPSSLDPLPDESLAGFLLRLAHRLETSPARILELAGFAGSRDWQHVSVIPHHVMLQLTDRERDGLALAARLAPAEADALCFGQLRDRFPLPPPPTSTQAPAKRFDWWLNTTFSRYCPQCLAGDGTVIQDAHGGAWQRAWRLPVVFACEIHQRLLEHRCPACRHPALGIHGNSGGKLVPGMMDRGLHPAQCRAESRTTYCGQRLDAPDAAVAPAAEVLDLQQRLTTLLRPDGPAEVASAGEPCSPRQYFTDLRLISYLAVTTWPRTRHLAPASQLVRSVDQLAGHHGPAGEKLARSPAALARPADASAGACLLLIAEQLLAGDNAAVREAVRELLPDRIDRANRAGWRLTFLDTDETTYSPGLGAAVRPLVSATAGSPARGGAASQNCAPSCAPSTFLSIWRRSGSVGISAAPPRQCPWLPCSALPRSGWFRCWLAGQRTRLPATLGSPKLPGTGRSWPGSLPQPDWLPSGRPRTGSTNSSWPWPVS